MPHPSKPDRMAFIGFGEAATAFLDGWGADRPRHVSAFDIKTDDPETRDGMVGRYRAHSVHGSDTSADALAGCEVVFCLVTADQAVAAAQAAANQIGRGALWFDCNSCAPDSKRHAADVIEASGARYVDVAVMAPVHPKKHRVPLLLSGAHTDAAAAVLEALGMCPEVAGDAVGQASSIKMLRSIIIKGFEALTAECLLAARRAGVEDQVLASLEESDPDIAWRRRGAYSLERMLVHGARRAAEMREVASTVGALRLPNVMSIATAHWQDEMAKLGVDPGDEDLSGRLDRALSAL